MTTKKEIMSASKKPPNYQYVEPMEYFDELAASEFQEQKGFFDRSKPHELIEPMEFFDGPNAPEFQEEKGFFDRPKPHELIEPMEFFDGPNAPEFQEQKGFFDRPKPHELIEPMEFFDGPNAPEFQEEKGFFDSPKPHKPIEPMEFFDEQDAPEFQNQKGFFDKQKPHVPVKPTDLFNEQHQHGLASNIGFQASNFKTANTELTDLNHSFGINKCENNSNTLQRENVSSLYTCYPSQKYKLKPPDVTKKFKVISTPNKLGTNAYTIARKFLSAHNLLVYADNPFIYNGMYYQHFSVNDIMRIIIEQYEPDVELLGSIKPLENACRFITLKAKNSYTSIESNAVCFQNGTFLLDKQQLLPHSPFNISTYGLMCNYITHGIVESPCFDAFINQAMGGDVGLIERIYEMIGYLLTPDNNGKVLFLLQGCSHSGKSVLSDLILSFFSEESRYSLGIHDLRERFTAVQLIGKQICISPDLPSGPLDNKSVSMLKKITGNDLISVDQKFQNPILFKPSTKFVLATNHPLLTQEDDLAFINRVVAIPFRFSIPKENQDHFLLERLKSERDAIATKAINAYLRLIANQYIFSGDYQLNTDASLYQQSNTSVGLDLCISDFLRNNFYEEDNAFVFTEDAYNMFVQKYGGINSNTFSQYFSKHAIKIYNAKKSRRRKQGETNPLRGIEGIAMSED